METHLAPPSAEAFGVPKGFVLTTWEAGRRVVFTADDNAPGGRPFLDAIEIQMAKSLRDQSADLELGKADIVELGPTELRRQAPTRKVWSSSPVRLMALVFGRRIADARVRQALSLAVDRTAIHSVLLQRQGEISGALLPQWISGYAFLFDSAADMAKARSLVATAPPSERSFSLTAEDPANRPIADRIQLNAHDAGLTVSIVPPAGGADVRLVEIRIGLADAGYALPSVSAALGLPEPPAIHSAEESYAAERALLDGFRVIPLFHLPDLYGAGPRVRGGPVVGPLGEMAVRQPLGGRPAMTFRTRLLLIFAVAVTAAVGMVELIVSSGARRAFEDNEAHRVNAVVAQFDNEFQRSGEEIVHTVEGIASSNAARDIAISPEASDWVDQAGAQASTHGLDLLELVAGDGSIVSSAQWPARFGYKDEWLTSEPDWDSRGAFLKREELPDGVDAGTDGGPHR